MSLLRWQRAAMVAILSAMVRLGLIDMPPMLPQPIPYALKIPWGVGENGGASGANQAISKAKDRIRAQVGAVQGVSPDVSVHLCTRVHPRLRISRVHRFPFALLHLSSVHLCTWYLV
jgi:hypothetical protein